MIEVPDIELKLLQVFGALLKNRSLSRTAEELNMSQAAMSRALAKLRKAFNDPLFIGTARGMEPTPRALAANGPIEEIMAIFRDRLALLQEFDHRQSDRTFYVAASDIGELILIPGLLRIFDREAARGIRLGTHPLHGQTLAQELQSGEVDAALGAFPGLEAGIRERRLYTERYVCLVRTGHPEISGQVSMEQFLKARHIVVAARTLGHIHGRVEKKLEEMLPHSAISVTSQSFLLSALLVSETDSVLIAPLRLAQAMQKRCSLQVLESPVPFESFEVRLYWHERWHHHPAHKWLRQAIVDALVGESSNCASAVA